ncbi:uncharacterized protein LOC142609274 [Castanea sativa]|uniref:uncharacterized protein LOC142609274 n=1 Tax=Castanea sativa TaxID=21020 RepID=UPI003F649940
MAHESQEVDDKMWPSPVEHIFIEIMLEEQLKGNMPNGVFKGLTWASITVELNQRTGKDFLSKQQNKGTANLRKQGCLDYPSLQQLFTPSIATGNLQISSNTPPLNSDEKRALKEELANANANASAPTHLDDDCYTPTFESVPQIVKDVEVEEVTQRMGKHPVQDASGKGKKVSKKSDRVSEMTVALKEYTAMTKDRYSGKLGRSSGSSDQLAQSGVGGDPCSLGKAMEVLNSYADLSNKAYIKMSKVLQQKDNRVVFMSMLEHRRKSWIEDILNREED